MAQLTDMIPVAGNLGLALVKSPNGEARLWTFAGTRANRCIARNIALPTEVKRIDALGLDLSRPCDLAELMIACKGGGFGALELEELGKPIKFYGCLPPMLVARIVRERQFEDVDFSIGACVKIDPPKIEQTDIALAKHRDGR